MAKPEPLKLKDIEDVILNEQLGDLTFHAMMDKISERIKSACEFYLKYKNNPEELIEDFPEYKEAVKYFADFEDSEDEELVELAERDEEGWEIYLTTWIDDKKVLFDYDFYNEWLFKLAFKDIMGDKE